LARKKSEIAFSFFNTLLMILLGLCTLLPFMHVLAKSMSGDAAVTSGRVVFLPINIQFLTYEFVLTQSEFLNSIKVSLFVTTVGTLLAMFLTVTAAYPLSKPGLTGRKIFLLMFVFIMLFNGGIIPNYMLFRTLGLLNKIWALVLSGALSVFNVLLVKTFFEQMPESVEESARIDGANNLRTLFSIVIPMSMPVIATVSLFYAVGYWNNYFAGVLYITRPALKPLQQFLFDLVTTSMTQQDPITIPADMEKFINMPPESIRAATIILSTIPILLVYPNLQKYFVKGINIGSVKG
jgi:putative aldouronate transport system permease protein